jgi:hypothetical protein
MSAGEREAGLVVIEVCVLPVAGGMTSSAIRAERTIMNIVTSVTCDTGGGGALILTIDVARRTRYLSMSTGEGKTSLVVVHTCASPTGGAVAGGAIGSQSAIVNVIPLVASDASGWGTSISSIRVTGGTSRAAVISG